MSIDLKQVEFDFVKMLPKIREVVSYFARQWAPRRDFDLVVTDSIGRAWVDYLSLVRRGKSGSAYATTLAEYAVNSTMRTLYGGTQDAMCHLQQHELGESFSMPVYETNYNGHADDVKSRADWHDVFTPTSRYEPSEYCQSDFETFLSSLTSRLRTVAERLAAGDSIGVVAGMLGISKGRVCQLKKRLDDLWTAQNFRLDM